MSVPHPFSSDDRVFPRPRLIWGSSEVIPGRWRLGLFCSYERHPGYPGTGLAISGRGLVRWALALAVAGYFAGSAALTYWFSRNPYSQVGFLDVLTWPVRREHMTQLRGRAWLAQGRDALKAKRWGEGVFLLGRGLEVCPEDMDARLRLAQIYLLFGQRQRGLALLADGPLHGEPSHAFLEEALRVATIDEDWERVVVMCDRCLPRLTNPAVWRERQWVLGQKLAALIALGRAAEALALAEAEGEGLGEPGKTQRVLALLALHRAGEAINLLGQWRESVPEERQAPILRLEVRLLRESGRYDEMEQSLLALRRIHPTQPDSWAFGVVERARAGQGVEAALADYVFRFGNSVENLTLVAQPLAEIPAPALVERLVAAAAERGFPVGTFKVKLADAWMRQGNWPAVARVLAEIGPEFGQAQLDARIWFEGIRRLSDAVNSPASGTQDVLRQFVQANQLSLDALRFIATALRKAGREETARDVLAAASRTFPASPWVRAQKVENAKALALAAGVADPTGESEKLAVGPKDWEEFTRSIDNLINAGSWSEARNFLKTMRFGRSPPPWVAEHGPELLWLEVRVAQALHEVPALRAAVRFYLNGTAVRSAEVLNFARDLRGRGSLDDALMLVKAVLEKSPEHPMAARYLKEWQPPVEKP